MEIPSGIRTDDTSAQLVAQLPVTLSCPWCQKTHIMRVGDGRFVVAAMPDQKEIPHVSRAPR
jgi:hypothetical protein